MYRPESAKWANLTLIGFAIRPPEKPNRDPGRDFGWCVTFGSVEGGPFGSYGWTAVAPPGEVWNPRIARLRRRKISGSATGDGRVSDFGAVSTGRRNTLS